MTSKAPLERTIVRNILEALRTRGAFAVKTYGSPVVTKGLPDIIGCYHGYYLALEVKRDSSGKPTPLQLFRIKEIRKAGGQAEIVWSVTQALDVLHKLDLKIAALKNTQKEGLRREAAPRQSPERSDKP